MFLVKVIYLGTDYYDAGKEYLFKNEDNAVAKMREIAQVDFIEYGFDCKGVEEGRRIDVLSDINGEPIYTIALYDIDFED